MRKQRKITRLGMLMVLKGRTMTDKRLVLSTASSQDEARRIANVLVELGLAACVNILPAMDSIYRWKDQLEEAEERLLLIKTTAAAFNAVCSAIQELHSYEVPECIALAIEDGSAAYMDWIAECVADPES